MGEKIGIIDVGGGMRGIYAAGVMDYCLENGIPFDLGIGVSAGSANLASFTARQHGRNLTFYTEYAFRKEYMGYGNFFRKGSFIDLDYVYGTLSNKDGENPLDYQVMMDNSADMIVVTTEAETGNPKYFRKSDLKQDVYHPFKASSAIPFVCKPYCIGGIPYFDGALADPVPIGKAFEEGCSKVVLVLSKPADIPRIQGKDAYISKLIRRKYPHAARKLEERAARYNQCVSQAKRLQEEGKVLVLSPDDTCGVDTLAKNKENLMRLYEKGRADARAIKDFIRN